MSIQETAQQLITAFKPKLSRLLQSNIYTPEEYKAQCAIELNLFVEENPSTFKMVTTQSDSTYLEIVFTLTDESTMTLTLYIRGVKILFDTVKYSKEIVITAHEVYTVSIPALGLEQQYTKSLEPTSTTTSITFLPILTASHHVMPWIFLSTKQYVKNRR